MKAHLWWNKTGVWGSGPAVLVLYQRDTPGHLFLYQMRKSSALVLCHPALWKGHCSRSVSFPSCRLKSFPHCSFALLSYAQFLCLPLSHYSAYILPFPPVKTTLKSFDSYSPCACICADSWVQSWLHHMSLFDWVCQFRHIREVREAYVE